MVLAYGRFLPKRKKMSIEFKGALVTRDAVLRALRQFEKDYPEANDYDHWLDKATYKYAVQFSKPHKVFGR